MASMIQETPKKHLEQHAESLNPIVESLPLKQIPNTQSCVSNLYSLEVQSAEKGGWSLGP